MMVHGGTSFGGRMLGQPGATVIVPKRLDDMATSRVSNKCYVGHRAYADNNNLLNQNVTGKWPLCVPKTLSGFIE
jgi:hypothetical protein